MLLESRQQWTEKGGCAMASLEEATTLSASRCPHWTLEKGAESTTDLYNQHLKPANTIKGVSMYKCFDLEKIFLNIMNVGTLKR